MKTGWLLYDECDYQRNRMFAAHFQKTGRACGLSLAVVLTKDMERAAAGNPDFVVSRQRNPQLNATLEAMGIPVFNNARVSEICNDKRNTHRFLSGLPLMKTTFISYTMPYTPDVLDYPLVVKPAFGHGGDRVTPVYEKAELEQALQSIAPLPALVQEMASEAGSDLRVYILFGQIVAAVMRRAKSGIVSNFKRGGSVSLHTLDASEQELAVAVAKRFADHGAPLAFAGIDLIYHHGHPVVNEVEDVVGSRMLYQVNGPDIIAMYAQRIAQALAHDNSGEL